MLKHRLTLQQIVPAGATALAVLILMGLPACQKKESSKLSVRADYLYVSGRAVLSTNPSAGLPNANISLGNDGPVMATTDSQGHFGFNISDIDLNTLEQSERTTLGDEATGNFKLFVETNSPATFGASKVLHFSDRGQLNTGDIELNTGGGVSGLVQRLPADGSFLPAQGVQIFAGNKSVTTDADGAFKLQELPEGETILFVRGQNYSLTKTRVTVAAGETTKLEFPLTIFPKDSVTGWVTVLPRGKTEDLIKAGHPFQRIFVLAASPLAKLVRYHDDRTELDKAEWKVLTERLSYDFPGNGGHNLYVQFANADKSITSSILTIQATVDIFDDTTGIVIGDGSGLITRRNADIHISLPHAATKMRLHYDIDKLTSAPFIAAASVTEYVFIRQQDPASGLVTIFVQFSDAQDNLSTVYKASAIMNLFPEAGTNVFTIEGGAAETPNRLVKVDIQVPANAYQMRVFEPNVSGSGGGGGGLSSIFGGSSSSSGETDPSKIWVSAQSMFFYTFATEGLKQLFVQFRDVDGALSSSYSAAILVQPFLPGGLGFAINDGSPSTLVRNVTLTLVPPPTAVAFRFAQGGTPPNSANWLSLVPHFPYSMQGRGLQTIYLQYMDPNGNQSLVYSQSISVDLFGAFAGSFVINGGAPAANFPTVTLSITAPLDATQMLITENPDAYHYDHDIDCHKDAKQWRSVAPTALYVFPYQGDKTLYVKFRNDTCDETGYISQTIHYRYQPFPAFNDGMIGLASSNVISVSGNQLFVSSRLLHVTLNVPAAAQYMIMSHLENLGVNPISGTSVSLCPSNGGHPTAVPYNSPASVDYMLPDVDGDYNIFVRYASDDVEGCTISAQYFSIAVTLQRFPVSSLHFSINHGDATTSDPNVVLNFSAPHEATYVKIAETPAGIDAAPILAISPNMPFTLSSAIEKKTVWAQYLTSSGNKSVIFSADIEVVP